MIIKMRTKKMRKLFYVLLMATMTLSCSKYVTIDDTVNRLKPPVTLVSRSLPRSDGQVLFKIMDGRGKTFTSRDNSLYSVVPGSVIVPVRSPSFKDIDKVLMRLKSPVIVIGKYGRVLKVEDKRGKIVTIDDITLNGYNVGDEIK